jgi:hypothetical protein
MRVRIAAQQLTVRHRSWRMLSTKFTDEKEPSRVSGCRRTLLGEQTDQLTLNCPSDQLPPRTPPAIVSREHRAPAPPRLRRCVSFPTFNCKIWTRKSGPANYI